MGKGFLERLSSAKERLEDVVGGVAGAADAVTDFVWDVAQAPATADEYGGMINALYKATTEHGAAFLQNVIGPDEGLGAAIGGLPEAVRDPLRGPVQGAILGAGVGGAAGAPFAVVGAGPGALFGSILGAAYGTFRGEPFEDAETAYREAVSEPVAAALTAGSLADAPGGGGIGGLFRGDTWRQAYRIAQGRSPGQALALAGLTGNILSDDEIAEAVGSDTYELVSGTADAVLRFKFDTSVVAAKAAKAARSVYIAEDVATGAKSLASTKIVTSEGLRRATNSTRVRRFVEAVDEVVQKHGAEAGAGRVHHQFFPNHEQGGYISDLLANAGAGLDDVAARLDAKTAVVASLLGDKAAFEALTANAPDLAHQIRNLTSTAGDTLSVLEQTEHNLRMFGHQEAADRIAARIETRRQQLQNDIRAMYPDADRVDRLAETFMALDEVPTYSHVGAVRATVSASAFYQKNALTKPLRTVSNMVPQHWINLHDPRSDVHIFRALRDSGLDEDRQMALRARYQAAVNPADRQTIAIEIENEITRSVLDEFDVPKAAVDKIISEATRLRTSAMGALSRRSYDAKGRGSIVVEEPDGTLTRIALPLHVTQQANLLPMVDVRQLRHAAQAAAGEGLAGKYRAFRLSHEATDIPANLLEGFYSLWRPATLLRVGWPARVLLDEQMRIIATIGALAHYREFAEQLPRYVGQTVRRVPRREATPLSRMLFQPVATADDLAKGNVFRGIGDFEIEVGGYTVDPAFGYPGDKANYLRQLNSSASTFREIVGAARNKLLTEMRKGTGSFRTFLHTESDYPAIWAHNVNNQIGQSAFARLALEGKSVDEMVAWLSGTDAGVAYAREMAWRPHTFRSHAEDVADQVNRYVPTPELRALALERDLTHDDLVQAVPEELLPAVHGEELAQALGTSALSRLVRNTVDAAWKNLGQLPTDIWSRNPYFNAVYRREVGRRIALLDEQTVGRLTDDDVAKIAAGARKKALNESQALLYDLAEKSQFAEMVRFVSPFYMAWQEVLTRWVGITIDNPVFAARARLLWNSPEKAGLVTDENGATIDENGVARDPLTGRVVEAGADRFITLPFRIPGLPADGPVRFNKRSLNLLLQGTPGAGPPMQLPVNVIVKNRPELEKSVEFILPFGTSQGTLEMLMPATGRRLYARAQQEEDRVFRNTAIRMYQDRLVDYNLGKRETKPTWGEVLADTKSLYSVRTVANYVAPFTPVFDSPYQPWINAYRQAQERLRGDPMALADENGNRRSADEWFYDEFGEEFFPLTQSLSQSKDGVMPTAEAFAARKKYRPLVEKYPDLGGFIIGSEGAGEFNRAVYDYQLANEVRPGSGIKQRETPSFEQAAKRVGARQGWLEYRRAMDIIDAERMRRGLPNLQVKAARDLAALKRAVTDKIADKHPDWYEQFANVDRNAMARRIAAFREIAEQFEGRKDRPEMDGMREYLRVRDAVSAELARRGASKRGAKTLSAKSNADLARLWESITSAIVDKNPAFADTYYRYLERDEPEAA
jgi:hypothetical protein